jgi:hypothetical protein
MDIRPSTLNVLIIGLSVMLFNFVMRLLAGWVEDRNPELSGAMGTLL